MVLWYLQNIFDNLKVLNYELCQTKKKNNLQHNTFHRFCVFMSWEHQNLWRWICSGSNHISVLCFCLYSRLSLGSVKWKTSCTGKTSLGRNVFLKTLWKWLLNVNNCFKCIINFKWFILVSLHNHDSYLFPTIFTPFFLCLLYLF